MMDQTHTTHSEATLAASVDPAAKPSLADRLHSPYVFDTLLAVGLTLFAWVQLLASRAFFDVAPTALARPVDVPVGFHPGPGIAWSFALLALCFLPLAFRRRYPVSVLALTVIGQVAISLITRDPILSLTGPLIALYTVALESGKRKTILVTAITAVLVVGGLWAGSVSPALKAEGASMILGSTTQEFSIEPDRGQRDGLPPFGQNMDAENRPAEGITPFAVSIFAITRGSEFTQMLEMLALIIAAAAFGSAISSSRQATAEARERAEEAEKTREEMARRKLEEERLRIARELHDITAHSLSAVAVQAGAAEKMVKTHPDLAEETIEQIRLTSKEALEELRSIVGVLRDGEPGADAPLVPEAGIERIGELALPLETSGIAVAIKTSEVESIPAYASLAAYRIVQEACTNVLRHAVSPTEVLVELLREGDVLHISVTDDGRGGSRVDDGLAASGGHGIAGMRERAIALGGTFEAGPRDGGGFEVSATLPLTKGDEERS